MRIGCLAPLVTWLAFASAVACTDVKSNVDRTPGADAITLHVTLLVIGQPNTMNGVEIGLGPGKTDSCRGADGFADLTEHALVKVTGDNGQVIGQTILGPGLSWNVDEDRQLAGQDVLFAVNRYAAVTPGCRFAFGITLPADQALYGFSIGNRATTAYRRADLQSGELDLKIGR